MQTNFTKHSHNTILNSQNHLLNYEANYIQCRDRLYMQITQKNEVQTHIIANGNQLKAHAIQH